MKYLVRRDLENRTAVDPAEPIEVEGTLLVGEDFILRFSDHLSQFGEDRCVIYPCFHKGEQMFLRRDAWEPAFGYSASGISEYLLSFDEGVKLLVQHEVFYLTPQNMEM